MDCSLRYPGKDQWSDNGFEDSVSQPILHLRGGGADKKRKEARKRKFAPPQGEDGAHSSEGAEPTAKKQRKQPSPSSGNEHAASGAELELEAVNENDGDSSTVTQNKPQRFIVFIGNLPYTTTDASLKNHFAKVQPTSIRHRTDKVTGKSKGFAFLEFAAFDRMKTCLKLYHHSNFDDGDSPARKINVELTVGGGGAKSRGRKTKLQAKNWKLSEERKRRAEEEAKAEKKNGKKKADKGGKLNIQAAEKVENDAGESNLVDNGDIHPSRRSRVTRK